MATSTTQPAHRAWRAIGASVRGAAHVRVGLPNQDALYQPGDTTVGPLVVAIADGHGSARCFRSHLGARFAVQAAVEAIHDALAGATESPEGAAATEIAGQVVRRWREAAAAHLHDAPFSADELAALEHKAGGAARRGVEATPLLAYGATLAAVCIADTSILYLQVGDGDVLAVSGAGDVTRPLPADARLFGGETTSLCAPGAARDFRVAAQPLFDGAGHPADRPALILLSTDGYANSFRDETGFRQVGPDLLAAIRAEGLDAVQASLEGWLDEASRCGSGDDVTLGIVCRLDAVSSRACDAGAARPSLPDPLSDEAYGETENGPPRLARDSGARGSQSGTTKNGPPLWSDEERGNANADAAEVGPSPCRSRAAEGRGELGLQPLPA